MLTTHTQRFFFARPSVRTDRRKTDAPHSSTTQPLKMRTVALALGLIVVFFMSIVSSFFRRGYRSRSRRLPVSIFASEDEIRPTHQLSEELLGELFPEATAYTEQDKLCIETRQLDRTVNGMWAVEKQRCKHGFPRAFVRSAITYPNKFYTDDAKMKTPGMLSSEAADKIQVSSGMLRLSCPHLVKAIDELEEEGGIEAINGHLIAASDEDDLAEPLRQSFLHVNKAWGTIRAKTMSSGDVQVAESYLGKEGATTMINSGIIGVTPNKVDDVKCLHAHLGDYLLRGENQIGELVIKTLEEQKDIDVSGCENCYQQCSSMISKEESQFWYMSRKNKEKLRATRDRKRENRL